MKKIVAMLMIASLLLLVCARAPKSATPTQQEVIAKAVVQALFSGDLDTGLGLLADDVVFRQEPGGIKVEGKGEVEALFRWLAMWKQEISITSPSKVDGDKVTFSGRVTGEQLRVIGMESMNADFELRVRDGRIKSWLSMPESKDWKRATELQAGGLGVRFEVAEQGLKIKEFVKNSPAAEAGLRVGDVIVAVDGINYSQMRPGEWQLRMRGPIGSRVRLAVTHEGATAPVDVEVLRADYERLWR